MKLVTFSHAGETYLGSVADGLVHQIDFDGDMIAFLASGAEARPAGRAFPEAEVRLLAPIPRPGKVLALAGNYQEHIQEGGGQRVDKSRVTPRVFMKPSSCVIGPGDAVKLPRVSEQVDWELELAVVIGRTAKHVSPSEARRVIAGYGVFNDISSRSLTIGASRDPRPMDDFFDWLNGKWQDTFGPFGPWLVTADEIPDPNSLAVRLWVNDVLRQNGSTAQMIFNVDEIVAFASDLMTLEPGDIIATGTPSGVGHASNTFLKPGDVVRGEIEGLGTLVNTVEG